MTIITQAHADALSKAKIALMARPDSAFFTTLCFSLKHVWDDQVSTAACDGTTIYWNPNFFLNQLVDNEERVFLLLHEAMHAAYLHMVRRGERDKDRWNIAADHVINLQLVERGFTMPTRVPGHADTVFAGLSTEEVYDRLPANPPAPAMPDLREPGDGSAQGDKEAQALEETMQDILVRAQLQSKMAGDKPGTIPGQIQIYLDSLLQPKLPWHRILQKYMQQMAKNDYSMRRPNRRFFPQHHLPSLYSEKLDDLAFAIDASASVSDDEFRHFGDELGGILKMMKPEKMTLVTFDTAVRSVDTVRSTAELLRVKFTGRGGTCIDPVLQWAQQQRPKALIVFSDGEFRFHTTTCKVPVIWAIHNNPGFVAPFGKVIHYMMEGRR